jgi:hypothetical protein
MTAHNNNPYIPSLDSFENARREMLVREEPTERLFFPDRFCPMSGLRIVPYNDITEQHLAEKFTPQDLPKGFDIHDFRNQFTIDQQKNWVKHLYLKRNAHTKKLLDELDQKTGKNAYGLRNIVGG